MSVLRVAGDNIEILIDTTVLDAILANAETLFDKVLAGGAFEVEGQAKMIAPVDTGALANSIKTTGGSHTYHIGPTVEYGIYQELGWHDRAGNYHEGKHYMQKALLTILPRVVLATGQLVARYGKAGAMAPLVG